VTHPHPTSDSATDPNDVLYSWSNTGNNVDLAAPGCVYTTNTVFPVIFPK